MILGLDLSTTVCGFTILKDDGTIEHIGYHSFKKENTMVEKGEELENFLLALTNTYKITECCIEERLKSFRAGGTNAEAMLKTAQINFLCQYLMKRIGVTVTEINVNTARKSVFPTFHKYAKTVKGTKHKEIIFKFVIEKLGESLFPKKTMKSGARKGDVVVIEEAKDMADSWVIATAGKNIKEKV